MFTYQLKEKIKIFSSFDKMQLHDIRNKQNILHTSTYIKVIFKLISNLHKRKRSSAKHRVLSILFRLNLVNFLHWDKSLKKATLFFARTCP